MKRTLLMIFCVLSGIVLGGMVASVCRGIPVLAWMAYSQQISVSPALDFDVIRLNMELTMGISVAQIFTIAAALFVYTRIKDI